MTEKEIESLSLKENDMIRVDFHGDYHPFYTLGFFYGKEEDAIIFSSNYPPRDFDDKKLIPFVCIRGLIKLEVVYD